MSEREIADGKEFADTFSRFCNDMRRKPREEAIKILLRDHPTIQQKMMGFCVDFIAGMAGKEQYDLRNQASVELARKIMQETTEQDRALPFI